MYNLRGIAFSKSNPRKSEATQLQHNRNEYFESTYVMGFSYSTGFTTTTFVAGRVEGIGLLYKEALEGLWINYGKR